MATFNVLYIFGYGETQIITDTENKKVSTDDLTKVKPVIDNIYSLKPADSSATVDYRTIAIHNESLVTYLDKQNNDFIINYSELDSKKVDALATEILNK